MHRRAMRLLAMARLLCVLCLLSSEAQIGILHIIMARVSYVVNRTAGTLTPVGGWKLSSATVHRTVASQVKHTQQGTRMYGHEHSCMVITWWLASIPGLNGSRMAASEKSGRHALQVCAPAATACSACGTTAVASASLQQTCKPLRCLLSNSLHAQHIQGACSALRSKRLEAIQITKFIHTTSAQGLPIAFLQQQESRRDAGCTGP